MVVQGKHMKSVGLLIKHARTNIFPPNSPKCFKSLYEEYKGVTKDFRNIVMCRNDVKGVDNSRVFWVSLICY